MTEDKMKVLIKIIDAQQKQLENTQQQISILTKELVKISTQVEKLIAK
tara:strand:- start:285 stop:428 length:144 start_codon:yes stop_codon:yes gene_type:complete